MMVIESRPVVVAIEPMRRRHLRQVQKIESSVHPRPWTVGMFLGELADRANKHYVVARLNGRVVGYAGLLLINGEAHVSNIAVDPELARQGIATRLMIALVDHSLVWGCDDMTLEVRVSNVAAQHLYFNFGFTPVGVRKGYYSDNREDALVLFARQLQSDEYRKRLEPIRARYAASMVQYKG